MSVADRYRRLLLLVAGGLFIGLPVELWLEGHVGDWLQWIPFVLCGIGLVSVAWALRSPGQSSYRVLRAAMLVVGLGGVYGVYSHAEHNFAFEREIRPAAALGEVIVEALQGASPLLAPGALVVAAFLGAAATFWMRGASPSPPAS